MSSTPHRPAGRVAHLALLALLAGACGPQAQGPGAGGHAAGRPALEVVDPQFPQAPEEVDLGVLASGEVVRRVVRLRNTTDGPLTIRDIQPGCTCTRVLVRYADPVSGEDVRASAGGPGDVTTLPAGVTAELELTVDTSIAPVRNKHKLVLVRLTTDSTATPFLTLSLRLLVESWFRPSPAVIDLRQVAIHGGGMGEVGIASDNAEGRRISGVLASPLEVVPQLSLQDVFGVEVWTLRVQLLPPVPAGYQTYEVLLATTGPGGQGEGPPLEVEVRATGVPDAAIDPPLVTLLAPADGGPPSGATVLVTRIPGQVLEVTSARVEGIGPRRIEVQAVPRAPDVQGRSATWDLRLVAREGLGDQPLTGLLVVETDDEQVPRLEARWVWRP